MWYPTLIRTQTQWEIYVAIQLCATCFILFKAPGQDTFPCPIVSALSLCFLAVWFCLYLCFGKEETFLFTTLLPLSSKFFLSITFQPYKVISEGLLKMFLLLA